MNVDASGIDPIFDAQRAVFPEGTLELPKEFGFGDDLLDPASECGKLRFDIRHCLRRLLNAEAGRILLVCHIAGASGKRKAALILGPEPAPDKVADGRHREYH
jgi:hypothetical protein